MSHSSPSRAQTEPLAALIAISAVVMAVGVYAVFVTDVVPGSSERDPSQAVLDQVWDDVGSGGVYHENVDSLGSNVRPPDGFTVYGEVTTTDAGQERVVSTLLIEPDGTQRSATTVDRPDDPQSTDRPISVERDGAIDGDVQAGTLRVEAW